MKLVAFSSEKSYFKFNTRVVHPDHSALGHWRIDFKITKKDGRLKLRVRSYIPPAAPSSTGGKAGYKKIAKRYWGTLAKNLKTYARRFR